MLDCSIFNIKINHEVKLYVYNIITRLDIKVIVSAQQLRWLRFLLQEKQIDKFISSPNQSYESFFTPISILFVPLVKNLEKK